MRRSLPLLFCTALIAGAFLAEAKPPNESEKARSLPPAVERKVDFVEDVEPILAKHCYDCHGEFSAEGQLRLDAKHIVFKGGVSGPSVVPGKSARSLLVERIAGLGGEDRMPLDADPLTDEQIGIVRAWIDQGATWPDGVGSDVRELDKHWAYVKPTRPELPAVEDAGWCRNAIDRFVLARIEEAGVKPSPAADRAKLLRRLYLDLIGLPPSVEEVDAFLADTRPDAYERKVDELLSSEHFGEKWARNWLDLARYADSNGFQADQYREVWPYRDWVVNALNRDMPFDRFTVEQIAGDLLPDATKEQKIATGFHRQPTCNVEAGVDPEENRVNQIIDRVNTTGTVWLGTTIGCVQCHGHPYDPFAQRDYYRLFAFFNGTPLEVKHAGGTTYNFYGPKMPVGLTPEKKARLDDLKQQHARLQSQLDELVEKAVAGQPQWEKQQRKRLAEAGGDSSGWQTLDVVSFDSQGGASHRVLEDGSILVSGKKPDTDTYTVELETDLTAITAFKLEALTHESLPGQGPGRHHPERPNFVLQELEIEAAPAVEDSDAKPVRVPLHAARADFAANRYDAAFAVDGKRDTGWAIHRKFHVPHWLTLRTKHPVGFGAGTRLTAKFVQNHGEGRTLGRFRLLACEGEPPADEVASGSGLDPALAKILKAPAGKRDAKQKKKLREFYLSTRSDVEQLRERLTKVKKQIDGIEPATTLVMVEMDEPRETHVFERGSFLNEGRKVQPGTPNVLHEFPDELPSNRLGLAKWLASPENPLVGRVTVNRWWAEIFGEGLVRTEEDFGTQGERPTHPKLLDWLAVEFVESGWSMKHVLRLIVTSATYRQTSRVSPERLARDPQNRLLARMPRFRLPAETVRDNALAISGLLSREVGGPPVYPPQPPGIWRHVGRNAPKYQTDKGEDRFRRGLYVVWRRSAPYPSFVNFDAPDRAACVVQRPKTNTPLQALTLLNDEAYVEMARALARRIAKHEDAVSDRGRAEYGLRLCIARKPKPAEVDFVESLFRQELQRFQKNPQAAQKVLGDADVPQGLTAEELAAWFYVSNVLLNLDETISKG